MREAAGEAENQTPRYVGYNSYSMERVGSATMSNERRMTPTLRLHQPSRHSPLLPSFPLSASPLTTSPSVPGPLRISTSTRKNSVGFHPYGSRPTSSSSNRLMSFSHEHDYKHSLPSPRSPAIPRKQSLTDSELSYGARPHSDREDGGSPPMTPMTEMSDDSPTIIDEHHHGMDPNMKGSLPAMSQQYTGGKRVSEHSKLERRRNAHLLSEKKRREKIKDGMDRLKKLVPSCRNIQDSKAISKAIILRNTTEFLQQVLLKQEKYMNECKLLRQENAELRQLLQSHSAGNNTSSTQEYRPQA